MPYKIEVRREDGIFISRFGDKPMSDEVFNQYIQEVIDLNVMFAQDGRTQVYHLLILNEMPVQFDFGGMLKSLTTVRHNKAIIDLRNRLHSMAILVTNSSAITQFIEAMLSNPGYGGRRMTLFPTLEKALEFIRFDQTNPPNIDVLGEEGL